MRWKSTLVNRKIVEIKVVRLAKLFKIVGQQRGFSFVEGMISLGILGFIGVIFLTALSDQMYEEAALIGGAVDFIEKSRSFTILKRRMDRAGTGNDRNRESRARTSPTRPT